MKSLGRIYKEYGGVKALLLSPFFWFSFLVTIGVVLAGVSESDFLDLPLRVSPPLIGFTIASFGLVFAVTSEDTRLILSQRDENLNNRIPLLVLVAKIVHAVFVQLLALVFVTLIWIRPIPYFECYADFIDPVNNFFFWISSFLFFYGISLIFSVAITLFTLVQLITDNLDVSE